jgi:hypothetical protein
MNGSFFIIEEVFGFIIKYTTWKAKEQTGIAGLVTAENA